MSRITDLQALAMMHNGFRHGVAGYPVLYAENGHVTIVEEKRTHLTVWEFAQDGTIVSRSYLRVNEEEHDADIPAGA